MFYFVKWFLIAVVVILLIFGAVAGFEGLRDMFRRRKYQKERNKRMTPRV